MRWLRLLLRAYVFATALFFVAGLGIASADDCSSPSDCSNTAWTVGGGAAAAAAIVAAAAAAGWLPGGTVDGAPQPLDPEGELSPECVEALSALAGPVRAALGRYSELTVAENGAVIKMIEAMARAAAFRDTAAGLGVGESLLAAASAFDNTADVVGVGRDMEAWRRAAAGAHNAAALHGVRETMEALARSSGGRAAAEYSRIAQRMAERSREAQAWADTPVGGAAGEALGPAGLLASAYQHFRAMPQHEGLVGAGATLRQSQFAEMEAERWESYARSVSERTDGVKAEILAAVRAYNARAEQCGAQPLNEDVDSLPRWGPDTGSAVVGSVPASVLDPGPQRLKEEQRPRIECDPARYAQEMAAMRRELQRWEEISAEYERRRQQGGDIEVTLNLVEQELARVDYEFAKLMARYRAMGTASALGGGFALTSLMALFSPPAAVVFGLGTLYLSYKENTYQPQEWHGILIGGLREDVRWLRQRRGYNFEEVGRQRDMLSNQYNNMLVRRRWLRTAYDECDGGAQGWEPPPKLPDFAATIDTLPPPQLRTLKEIGTWR